MSNVKQVVSLFNASIIRGIDSERLQGSPVPGRHVITSRILHKEGNNIETKNTHYKVITWETTPDYLKGFKFS